MKSSISKLQRCNWGASDEIEPNVALNYKVGSSNQPLDFSSRQAKEPSTVKFSVQLRFTPDAEHNDKQKQSANRKTEVFDGSRAHDAY